MNTIQNITEITSADLRHIIKSQPIYVLVTKDLNFKMKKTKLNYKAKNYNLDEVLDKIDIVYSEITVKKANATKARLKESMKLKDKIVKRLSYVSIKKIKIGVEKDKILDAKS